MNEQQLLQSDHYIAADHGANVISAMTGILRFDLAVVLGSGWADTAESLGTVRSTIPFHELPGFVETSVPGHESVLRVTNIGHQHALIFGGRSHLYEGHRSSAVVHPIRIAKSLGCKVVVLTNAAGGINAEYEVGQPVLIADHLNLSGASPMVGPAPPPNRPGRFCDMNNAYSPRLRAIAREIDPSLVEGVYAGVLGGSYETPAEVRMLRGLGADMVGMSTVHETIAARHLGMEVFGVSMITNAAAGLGGTELNHADVLVQAAAARPRVAELLRSFIESLP